MLQAAAKAPAYAIAFIVASLGSVCLLARSTAHTLCMNGGAKNKIVRNVTLRLVVHGLISVVCL